MYRSKQLSMKSVLLFRYMQIYSDLWSTLDIAVCVHTYLFLSDAFFSSFSIESISFSPSVFEQICLVAGVSSGGGGAWKDGGWGFVKETGAARKLFISAGDGGGWCGDQAFFCRQN